MPFSENNPYLSASAAPAGAQSVSSWWGLLGMLLIFLIILLVCLWIIRRFNRIAFRSMNAPWARVLDRQVLSGQQSLYLVEVAGQLQVIGGTDHHLVKISEIDDPVLAAEILEEIATRPTEGGEEWTKRLANLWHRPSHRKGRKGRKDSFSKELERLLEEVEK